MIAFMNIALAVSVFLLNSDRIQKAIKICSECLILLNSTDQNSKDQFDSVLPQFYSDIFTVLFSKMLFVLYRKSGIMLQTPGDNQCQCQCQCQYSPSCQLQFLANLGNSGPKWTLLDIQNIKGRE